MASLMPQVGQGLDMLHHPAGHPPPVDPIGLRIGLGYESAQLGQGDDRTDQGEAREGRHGPQRHIRPVQLVDQPVADNSTVGLQHVGRPAGHITSDQAKKRLYMSCDSVSGGVYVWLGAVDIV
jgi:hypothetical protein